VNEIRHLFQKQELIRLNENSCLQPIEIHAAGKAARVKSDFMVSGIPFPLHEHRHLLPQRIEYG
jgi:hypothetical protein